MSFRSVAFGMLSAAAVVLPTLAAANAAAPETHLDFTVLKDGSPIGHHKIDLSQTGDGEKVSIRTDVLVKVAFVPVYRFEHRSSEVWKDGRLVALQSQTNDDGDKHKLSAEARDGSLEIVGDGARSEVGGATIPASLWNHDLVKQRVLMNTLTGKPMAVSIADLGEELVRAHGEAVRARHYQVTGELMRDLWYDPAGQLVQVGFKAKDSSNILYTLE